LCQYLVIVCHLGFLQKFQLCSLNMNIHRTPKEDQVKYKLLGQEISKIKDERTLEL
jgi:hypothetical protein